MDPDAIEPSTAGPAPTGPRHIGLVLGAGGLAGHAFHAGVLAAMSDWFEPNDADVIVGTSAGSGMGGFVRAGVSAQDVYARAVGDPLSDEGRRRLERVTTQGAFDDPPARTGWLRPQAPRLLATELVQPWKWRPGRFWAAIAPEGSRTTSMIGDRQRALHGPTWPSRALWICALRLRDGQRVVFGRDGHTAIDVGTAVEASSAIPSFFAPVEHDGERFVDGGAHSPTNADLVADIGLDAVVIVAPMSGGGQTGIAALSDPGRAYHEWLVRREMARIEADGTAVLLVTPDGPLTELMRGHGLSPSQVPVIARAARAMAEPMFAAAWPTLRPAD